MRQGNRGRKHLDASIFKRKSEEALRGVPNWTLKNRIAEYIASISARSPCRCFGSSNILIQCCFGYRWSKQFTTSMLVRVGGLFILISEDEKWVWHRETTAPRSSPFWRLRQCWLRIPSGFKSTI